MKLNIKNIFFSILLVVSSCFIALSYNFETRALIEGTILSGTIDYPNEFNLFRVLSLNAWSLPIQVISFLIKAGFSPLTISRIILLTSTLMFFVGIFLITKFFTNSYVLSFLVAFLVVLLKKNFGSVDYPTMMFTEHTGGLMAQALSTLVFGLLVNNNFKSGFFFSVMLLSVHVTVGLWVNFMIFLTFILKITIHKNLILNKKILTSAFVGLTIVLISFFYFLGQKVPLNFIYDHDTYETYMKTWEAHRTTYGMYSSWMGYEYLFKTLLLICLIFIFLKLKTRSDNFIFGVNVLFLSCILSFILYLSYKYFFFLFPDIITRVMPTRFILLHSVIGWPIIFSILYIFVKNIFTNFNFNLKYVYFFFVSILIFNLFQHKSNFIERYEGIKTNLLFSDKIDKNDKFWNKIKATNSDGFFLTDGDFQTCIKTVIFAKKPLFICPEYIDLIPYFPSAAVPTKKIIEEVLGIPFDNPEVKHTGGVNDKDLKFSYENKSNVDWVSLKNQFNITGLIVPKKWKINLKVYFSSDDYNFYIIQ